MNIAFLVNNLSKSEIMHELIELTNKNNLNYSIQIFFQNISPPMDDLKVLTMNVYGLSEYTGKLVCCGMEQAIFANTNKSKTENYLYLPSLVWMQKPVLYDEIIKTITGFKKIFVPSEDYKNIVYNLSGFDNIHIVKDFEDMLSCLN